MEQEVFARLIQEVEEYYKEHGVSWTCSQEVVGMLLEPYLEVDNGLFSLDARQKLINGLIEKCHRQHHVELRHTVRLRDLVDRRFAFLKGELADSARRQNPGSARPEKISIPI